MKELLTKSPLWGVLTHLLDLVFVLPAGAARVLLVATHQVVEQQRAAAGRGAKAWEGRVPHTATNTERLSRGFEGLRLQAADDGAVTRG